MFTLSSHPSPQVLVAAQSVSEVPAGIGAESFPTSTLLPPGGRSTRPSSRASPGGSGALSRANSGIDTRNTLRARSSDSAGLAVVSGNVGGGGGGGSETTGSVSLSRLGTAVSDSNNKIGSSSRTLSRSTSVRQQRLARMLASANRSNGDPRQAPAGGTGGTLLGGPQGRSRSMRLAMRSGTFLEAARMSSTTGGLGYRASLMALGGGGSSGAGSANGGLRGSMDNMPLGSLMHLLMEELQADSPPTGGTPHSHISHHGSTHTHSGKGGIKAGGSGGSTGLSLLGSLAGFGGSGSVGGGSDGIMGSSKGGSADTLVGSMRSIAVPQRQAQVCARGREGGGMWGAHL